MSRSVPIIEEMKAALAAKCTIKEANDLLQKHIDECEFQGDGCNDLAPEFTGKIFRWSKKNTVCEIYSEYTTKDSPTFTECPIGMELGKLISCRGSKKKKSKNLEEDDSDE